MDKKKIFNHFSAILNDMIDNSLFWDTYFQMPSTLSDVYGSIDDVAVPENINIYFGISRGCIVDDNYNYVVKFDVGTDNRGNSICEREVDLYNSARSYGVEKYLVEAEYIGTYTKTITFYDVHKMEYYIDWFEYDPDRFDEDFMNREDRFGELKYITIEIPLYAYIRANPYHFTMVIGDEEEKCYSIAKSIQSPLRGRAMQVAVEFIYLYGADEYERFTAFLEDNEINDLHRDNIGELNGQFVLIDFGSFYDGHDEFKCEWNYEEEVSYE